MSSPPEIGLLLSFWPLHRLCPESSSCLIFHQSSPCLSCHVYDQPALSPISGVVTDWNSRAYDLFQFCAIQRSSENTCMISATHLPETALIVVFLSPYLRNKELTVSHNTPMSKHQNISCIIYLILFIIIFLGRYIYNIRCRTVGCCYSVIHSVNAPCAFGLKMRTLLSPPPLRIVFL